MDQGTLKPLTLHVPYSGCENCRSQLEAHSFSNKPVPTTDGRWNALSVVLWWSVLISGFRFGCANIPRGLNVRCTSACAFTTVVTIHLPRSGGASSPGQMQRIVTRSFGLLVWPEVSSPDIADSASPPRFHPRYCLARKPRKSPSTLSAFAMFAQVSSGGVLMGGLALVISTPTGFRYSWLGYRHQL